MDASAEIFAQVDNMLCEVEMPSKCLESFKWEYNKAGCGFVPMEHVILRESKGTGINCRIYFNADDFLVKQLAMFGFSPTDRDTDKARGTWRNEYRFRLDSNELFWKLTRNGFKLGYWPVRQFARQSA